MKKVKSTPIPTKYVSRLFIIDNENGADELVDLSITWTIYSAQEGSVQEQEDLAQEE